LLLEQLNLTGGLINQRAERGRGPNSIVEPDPARNFLHIRTDALAKIGYFVDEGDLGGQGGWCRGSELGSSTMDDRSQPQLSWHARPQCR
jgi:hypothetical protein